MDRGASCCEPDEDILAMMINGGFRESVRKRDRRLTLTVLGNIGSTLVRLGTRDSSASFRCQGKAGQAL